MSPLLVTNQDLIRTRRTLKSWGASCEDSAQIMRVRLEEYRDWASLQPLYDQRRIEGNMRVGEDTTYTTRDAISMIDMIETMLSVLNMTAFNGSTAADLLKVVKFRGLDCWGVLKNGTRYEIENAIGELKQQLAHRVVTGEV